MKTFSLISSLVATLAAPALADGEGILTYDLFETAVAHVNLEECPDGLAGEGRFCRMTMHNDAMHVFAFTEEGEQPMVGLRTYYTDEMTFGFDPIGD